MMEKWGWPRSCAFQMAARAALGGVFIYASLSKIADPAAFAGNVQNYHLLPLWSTNLVALYLPWVEFLAGMFLLAGTWVRGSALVLSSLLVLFIGGVGQAAARGIKLHCGCFASQGEPADVGGILLHVAGNALLLGLGVLLFRGSSNRVDLKGKVL